MTSFVDQPEPKGSDKVTPTLEFCCTSFLLDPVQRRPAAAVIGRIRREPHARPEVVSGVHLIHRQRVLAAAVTAEKIVVVRIQPDACGRIREPVSQRNRDADLRLEGPAVGADVDETCRVVLTCRHDHAQARADRRLGRALRKRLRADRGIAHEVRREPQAQVAQCRTVCLPCRIEDLAGDVRLSRTARRSPRSPNARRTRRSAGTRSE